VTAGKRGERRPAEERGRRVTRWLVDGMNVIGSRPDRWWNDPDKAVRRLIEELDRYAEEMGDEVGVVFDRRPRDVSPGMHGAISVAFASRRGRNAADHEIAEMVGDDDAPETLTVVTSDRDLADRVRQRGARVASSGSFRRRLDEVLEGRPA
jgi:predicted RNA-binding protein with PIN domain